MTKILVIEDEPTVRANLVDLLEAENFETIAAENGKIGIEKAIAYTPDLILCDMMIPEMDGYGVLTTLREEPKTSVIPLIFLTAKASKSDIRQGMDLGADDYLTKPFTRAELLSAIFGRLERQASLKKYLHSTSESSASSSEINIIKNCLLKTLDSENFHEFQVHYQPIVDIETGKIIAAESLVRWHSPELGLVSPTELIPLAESTGLIIPISEWILNAAFQQLKTWVDKGFSDLRLSVNVSVNQLNQPDFCENIIALLDTYHLAPQNLELEVSENSIIRNFKTSVHTINQLKQQGIKIAVDDFGLGDSSLMLLHQMPVDILKIFRYFIHKVSQDTQKAAITKSMIQMARSLDLYVVAKSVENEEELDFLQTHGCNAIQGFLFSQAVVASEFEEQLMTDRRLATPIS